MCVCVKLTKNIFRKIHQIHLFFIRFHQEYPIKSNHKQYTSLSLSLSIYIYIVDSSYSMDNLDK